MSAGRQDRMNRIAAKAINTTLAYAVISAVFLFVFAEELGYTVYNSYDAGYYISTLALVVPIMYLDHVTDSILKGVGEQVFSMWVNITDSLLSVILVWFLIPRMGIMGYAVVIVVMESYNFALSFYRLKRRISFKISFHSAILIPLVASFFAAYLSRKLFCFGGSTTEPVWLILKILFAICAAILVLALVDFKSEISRKKSRTA